MQQGKRLHSSRTKTSSPFKNGDVDSRQLYFVTVNVHYANRVLHQSFASIVYL
jgi:hypothetical protein